MQPNFWKKSSVLAYRAYFLCSNVDLECYELWRNSGEEKKVMSILRTNKKTNTTERLTGYIPIIKLKKGFTL